jgi:hypothetical protein
MTCTNIDWRVGWLLSLATRRHPLESGPLKCCMINKTWWMYVKSISSVCLSLSLSILPGDFILKLAKSDRFCCYGNTQRRDHCSNIRCQSTGIPISVFFSFSIMKYCSVYIHLSAEWLRLTIRIRLTHANMKNNKEIVDWRVDIRNKQRQLICHVFFLPISHRR